MHRRLAKRQLDEALEDTRVVLIVGPRQSGKTTLAMEAAREDMPYVTLDDVTQLNAAQNDPVGFLRGVDRAVIDEVQRVPELLLTIKAEVDRDKRAGRFLLTGSADLMTLPIIADSLAGRMEVVQLLPLAQAEIKGGAGGFLEQSFTGQSPSIGTPALGDELVELVLAGGYPEAQERARWKRRQTWYLNYIDAIVQRDVQDIAQIEKLGQLPPLLSVLAHHSGQLVNYSGIGAALGMNHVTTRKYVSVFQSLYLVTFLQPWLTNKLKRLTKSPKLHFLDSGLLAALNDVSPEKLAEDRTAFGPILETFVVGEVMKMVGWSDERFRLSQFRDKDGHEVDLVVENQRGEIVAIEVKASATVRAEDFRGIKKLASVTGDKFRQGIVLYDHDQAVPFGENLRAVPISALWG